MTYHARKQIRDHVVAGLTGLATTAGRVYPGRTRPLAAGHLPTLLVYMRSETSKRAVAGIPPLVDRVCTLYVEGRVSTTEVPDDMLDQIAAEVESGIATLCNINVRPVQFFSGLASNVQLTTTEIVAEADAERHIGGVRLEYLVSYRVVEGAPTAIV